MRPARSKLLIAAVALPIVVAILTAVVAPEPSGHWVEHLSSVALRAAVGVVLVGLAVRRALADDRRLGAPRLRIWA